jgi:hypothetical protein
MAVFLSFSCFLILSAFSTCGGRPRLRSAASLLRVVQGPQCSSRLATYVWINSSGGGDPTVAVNACLCAASRSQSFRLRRNCLAVAVVAVATITVTVVFRYPRCPRLLARVGSTGPTPSGRRCTSTAHRATLSTKARTICTRKTTKRRRSRGQTPLLLLLLLPAAPRTKTNNAAHATGAASYMRRCSLQLIN